MQASVNNAPSANLVQQVKDAKHDSLKALAHTFFVVSVHYRGQYELSEGRDEKKNPIIFDGTTSHCISFNHLLDCSTGVLKKVQQYDLSPLSRVYTTYFLQGRVNILRTP